MNNIVNLPGVLNENSDDYERQERELKEQAIEYIRNSKKFILIVPEIINENEKDRPILVRLGLSSSSVVFLLNFFISHFTYHYWIEE